MLNMFVLLEGFDEEDLACGRQLVTERAGRVETLLVGVNSRDLDTLQVVPDRFEALAAKLPAEVPQVAESGVATALKTPARLARAGYQVVLVGSALMADDQPETLVGRMLQAGRAARVLPRERGITRVSRRSMFIKICGMTSESAVVAAVECGVDAVGFVFAPSPRRSRRNARQP